MDLQQEKKVKNLEFLVGKFLQEHKLAASTRRLYGIHLANFVRAMPERIDDMRLENIERYIFQLERKLSGSTVSSVIGMIKAFFRWRGDNGGVDMGRRISRYEFIQKDARCLTKEEYDKCLSITSNQKYLDIFIVLCNTGLRNEEFITLKKENITGEFIKVIGKGKRKRIIPINAAAKEALARNPNLEFMQGRSKKFLWRAMSIVAKAAGVEPFHPHSCRHTFATFMYEKSGWDIVLVSKLLGHASVETTMRYLKCDEYRLRGATDVLD